LYKNLIIFHGGETKFNKKLKCRECLNDYLEYNIDLNKFSILKIVGDYVEGRRNHASSLMG